MTRYSYQPVAEYLGGSARTQAEILGVTSRTIVRWKSSGLLRRQAEHVADTLRAVPYEFWPRILDENIIAISAPCAADGCDRLFIPYRAQRFCSARCRRREQQRRYRNAHPEQRHKDRERARRYYADTYQRSRARKTA